MVEEANFVPSSTLVAGGANRIEGLPRDCTFTASDWHALAPFWYPVAFSHEVTDKPYAARLLDERVVVYRLSDGSITAARDICYHRGVPMSLGYVEGDEIVCKYHGLRYDSEGRFRRGCDWTSLRRRSASG
jgi:vanillate O-demethylase monooxygenase subunit